MLTSILKSTSRKVTTPEMALFFYWAPTDSKNILAELTKYCIWYMVQFYAIYGIFSHHFLHTIICKNIQVEFYTSYFDPWNVISLGNTLMWKV